MLRFMMPTVVFVLTLTHIVASRVRGMEAANAARNYGKHVQNVSVAQF